jgi:flagella basal body P-ring formation protein FlgA
MKKLWIHKISWCLVLCLCSLSAYAQSSFSAEQLQQAALNYARKMAGEDAEIIPAQAQVQAQEFPEDDIRARCWAAPGSLRGRSNVAIEFLQEGRVVRRIQVPVMVRIYARVPVAVRALQAGATVQQDDILYERRDITSYRQDEIIGSEAVSGLMLRRAISAGTVLTNSLCMAAGSVKKGNMVQVIVQSGGVIISTRGTALADASPGQSVRVQRDTGNGMQQMLGVARPDGSVYIGPAR